MVVLLKHPTSRKFDPRDTTGSSTERREDPDRAQQGRHDRHRPDDASPWVPHVVLGQGLRDPRGGQGLHQVSERISLCELVTW